MEPKLKHHPTLMLNPPKRRGRGEYDCSMLTTGVVRLMVVKLLINVGVRSNIVSVSIVRRMVV